MPRKELTEREQDIRNGITLDADSYDENGRFIRPANRRQERVKRKRANRKVGLPGNPDVDLPYPEELGD